MKLDRLLSIVIFLLNHELVSARTLAERFGVAVRTIQRDMDVINLAGIPIVAAQGPYGGYGIMENFKLDKRLLGADDLFNIVTALKGIASSRTHRCWRTGGCTVTSSATDTTSRSSSRLASGPSSGKAQKK